MVFVNRFELLTTRISQVAAIVGAGILAVMVLQVFGDVALRTIANQPLPATLEIVSNWWMVALSFLGLMYAKTRNEHISVSLLSETVPIRMRYLVQLSIELITIVILGLLAYHSLNAAIDAMRLRETASGIFPIMIWPARFFLPVGVALYAMAAISSILTAVQRLLPENNGSRPHVEGTQHD